MLVAAGASLALALRAPLTVTVLGLILFGVLHNVLEIRYVAGRFASLLTGRFLALLLALTSGIAVCRLTRDELADGGPVRRGRGRLRHPGGRLLDRSARYRPGWLGSASSHWRVRLVQPFPAYHFVVLTHLHNLVPLVFLWDWARRIAASGPRLGFRLTQVLWIVGLPLLILAGALDRWVSAAPGVAARFVGDGSRIDRRHRPAGRRGRDRTCGSW